MPLHASDKLGPYEILALIGAGGMGEVYRALDPRLNRDVAIKVSAQQFSDRFEREARAVAALNHPNICTLYDVGPNYLVMEYIEGEAPKGPYALEEALRIAAQIRDALEAAHEKGITHRDLKPANIKIRPDGTVKVLDFGLAKQSRDREGAVASDPEHSPTLTIGMTEAGMILGTAGYMSPEQARGKTVDKRADIWAFGVVLYEMLTGRRLFEGEDMAETLAAVIHKEPGLSQVPAKVQRLLQRCLAKDPKRRLRDIGDAWELLEDVGQAHGLSTTGHGPVPPRWPWAVAGVLAVALAVSLVMLWPPRAVDHPPVRLDVDLGTDVSLGSTAGADAILSPDGTRLVYVSQQRLYTRKLDQPKATELAGTQGAFEPFFSPDGQWVAFFANGKLKKISVEGGAAITLCDANFATGGSWGEDGNIIAGLGAGQGLSRIPSTGGAPTLVTELAQGEVTHRWPQILPGGKAVLFTTPTATRGSDGANIEVISLVDHRRTTLQRGGTYGRYLPTSKGAGHLVYINKGTLFAVPFDLDTLAVRGTPAPLLEGVAYNPAFGFAQLDFSRTGTLVYRSGGAATGAQFTVQWLDSTGKTQALPAKPDSYLYPHLSPDGQRLALSSGDIWIYEWQRDTLTRLTFSGAVDPVWSPDGRFIAFGAPGGGIFWTRSDGAGKPQPLIQSKNAQLPYSFTADGKRLAFQERTGGELHLWTVPLESDGAGLRAGKPEPFLQTQFNERSPVFSPDGRWLAYASDESGVYQVYVRAFPDKGGKWQISNNGGVYPVWARNGRDLFFRTEDNLIMVAAYTGKGDSFVADKPRVWSEKRIGDSGLTGTNYDVAPDGKRIVALMPAGGPDEQKTQSHVIFLQNFFDEVRRRTAPGGK
jgi:Tol biopolymer transport system component/predicted Ser/Thr protein kinase